MKLKIAIIFLFSLSIFAQEFRVCIDSRRGSPVYTDVPCPPNEFSNLFVFHCDKIQNLPNCNPPQTFTYENSRPPYNTSVQFGGVTTRKGEILWIWLRNNEILYYTRPFYNSKYSQ